MEMAGWVCYWFVFVTGVVLGRERERRGGGG
jgi:hypothetical protein